MFGRCSIISETAGLTDAYWEIRELSLALTHGQVFNCLVDRLALVAISTCHVGNARGREPNTEAHPARVQLCKRRKVNVGSIDNLPIRQTEHIPARFLEARNPRPNLCRPVPW